MQSAYYYTVTIIIETPHGTEASVELKAAPESKLFITNPLIGHVRTFADDSEEQISR